MSINVLVTSVGRRAPLVQVFKEAQKRSERYFNGRVITVNIDYYCAGLYVSDAFYIVPSVNDQSYIPTILDICKKEKIDLLIPTIDDELPIFAKYKSDFASIGTIVVISPLKTTLICNDKLKTYEFFLQNGIPTPKTFLLEEHKNPLPLKFPFIIKPRRGRGSFGVFKVSNKRELSIYRSGVQEPLVQEYLMGQEYTLDVLCDLKGKIISVVPRSRLRVRAGVSDQGRTIKDWQLIDYGIKIAKALSIIGPANIQCFINEGEVKFTEVNPRFSGGIPLTIAAGVDFPALLIKMAAGEEIQPMIGQFKENLTMLRYEMSVFREDIV